MGRRFNGCADAGDGDASVGVGLSFESSDEGFTRESRSRIPRDVSKTMRLELVRSTLLCQSLP